jgi:hypothetical protein
MQAKILISSLFALFYLKTALFFVAIAYPERAIKSDLTR